MVESIRQANSEIQEQACRKSPVCPKCDTEKTMRSRRTHREILGELRIHGRGRKQKDV
jgi:hypothetical protein